MPALPDPTLPFDVLCEPTRLEPGRFRAVFPEGWLQGRGCFGGLVLATLARAVELELDDPRRRIRSVQAELCGPTQAGEATLLVERLRMGSNVSSLAVRLVQGDAVQAFATMTVGASRAVTEVAPAGPPPAMPRWQDLEPLPIGPPLGPEFAPQFDFRSAGPFPFSGHPVAESAGFVRPKNPGTRRDAAFVLGCADTWWPSRLTCMAAPRPMATISFALSLVKDPATLDPAEPLFHRGREVSLAEGYTVDVRELWTTQGELVSLNQQTLAIIR